MATTLRSSDKLIEIETGQEWKVERRTRGKDGVGKDPFKPVQTWIYILVNSQGHKQFIPEERIWTLFQTPPPKESASSNPVEAS